MSGYVHADDANGNTTSKTDSTGTTTYTWDFENRLTSVALPGTGGTVSFKYDPLGRRIYKSSPSGTSIYAYDDYDLIEETAASGAVVAPLCTGDKYRRAAGYAARRYDQRLRRKQVLRPQHFEGLELLFASLTNKVAKMNIIDAISQNV